ncbi:helix-turn-helix domain-containing protein [Leifsonia poae]|uniref:helix-turn-helix domain-containing protein n=1 Tax=Leifsonia poae TaxID=110933 RepID=UPI003D690425
MAESGTEADARRLNVLLQPDGSLYIRSRLAPWVKRVLLADLQQMRRARSVGEYASDVLELLDALMSVPGQPVMDNSKINTAAEVDGFSSAVSASNALASAYLCSDEVAVELGVTARTVRRLAQSGRLQGLKSGHSYVFTREALENYKEGA